MDWVPQDVWLRGRHKVDGQEALETTRISISRGIDTYIAVQSHSTEN